jgi:uroporphyrin-III C-methyltransferase/precorrin-2 dehydrogenase/sirohydrochlorin ferrochelatase
MNGFVSLVGAGPGDPDLLTVKAARRLAQADLVLYDALVSPAALELASHAQRFFVGKRAHKQSVRQETIHWLMIRAARKGKRVVRLKCGDPFVFGRGGEEALALAQAGIAFEVVPGVTSAIAAPGLAGIPVTHRGVSSGFVVVPGHSETGYGPILKNLAPNSVTVVVLMGLGARTSVASFLIARGWRRETPAAVLLAASTPNAAAWTGTLESLSRAPEINPEDPDAPGTLVIGDVVAVAAQLGLIPSSEAGGLHVGSR